MSRWAVSAVEALQELSKQVNISVGCSVWSFFVKFKNGKLFLRSTFLLVVV